MRAPPVIYFLNALSQRCTTAPSCLNLLTRGIAEMLTQRPRREKPFEEEYTACPSEVDHRFATLKRRFAQKR